MAIAGCVLQGTLFGRRPFAALRFTEDRSIWWKDYEFIQRARQCYRMVRFDLPTYRYYRGSGTSLTDSVKAAWPHTPVTSAPKGGGVTRAIASTADFAISALTR